MQLEGEQNQGKNSISWRTTGTKKDYKDSDCNSKEAQSIVLYFKCCLNIVLMIKISLSTSEFKKQIR